MTALVIARFIHFSSLLLLCGALSFRLFLSLRHAEGLGRVDRKARPVFVFLAATTALSAIGWLLAEAAYMAGSWSDAFDPRMLIVVLFDTEFGSIWTVRLVLAPALIAATLFETQAVKPFSVVLSSLMVASVGLVGHAGMEVGIAGVVHRTAHALHLLAASAWVGGLWFLVCVIRLAKDQALSTIERFSSFAFAAVVIVVGTGIANSAFLLSNWSGLLTTGYGRVLSCKIACVLMMIILAIMHRFVFLPRSVLQGRLSAFFRRSVVVEAVLGLIVIVIVSALGTLPPPG